ncbi:GlxA family transcriptional regulator [Rhodococcus artemisiae]|uniref:Helix-turn-helix domain-containing protein n=1 Tax=Rhodococcus artemisiae TaxID=714159 RepID=A0ABU7LFH8_9NOCA|nr:helix-turn-helix domain-containing protein [Rhodococcus artemisiae]MEE2060022.1 helix-turn-helix domain-containing protein [Rhodococcus artemisiae]
MAGRIEKVVVPLLPRIEVFELGVACEVFGSDRSGEGLPTYDFSLVAGSAEPVSTSFGYSIDVPYDLARLDDADLIIVPPGGTTSGSLTDPEFVRNGGADAAYLEPLFERLRAAVDRGASVASLCTGAFVLGAAGILNGRRCTTHWRYADRLAEMYPSARVDRDVLYVDDEPVLTSAGTAASVDLSLHIVRTAQGAQVANTIARGMVVPPHRDGGQAQYVATPLPECTDDSIAPLLDWITENLHRDLSVTVLAEHAHMSSRTFARRFTDEAGTTPARWIRDQRVLAAQQLLENTDLPIDVVADRVGFGTAPVLRQHFLRLRRTTPQAYRRTFRSAESAPVE